MCSEEIQPDEQLQRRHRRLPLTWSSVMLQLSIHKCRGGGTMPNTCNVFVFMRRFRLGTTCDLLFRRWENVNVFARFSPLFRLVLLCEWRRLPCLFSLTIASHHARPSSQCADSCWHKSPLQKKSFMFGFFFFWL